MTNERHVVTLDSEDHIENLTTLLAYTYGHTIPLSVQTETIDEQAVPVLKVDQNHVPDHLVEQAKQICRVGYERYHNQE